MRFLGVIPARYASTRLPGKPLLKIAGRPLIEWVYRRAKLSESLDDVIVATDDERVAGVVRDFGGRAELTSKSHRSGTDRVAEIAASIEADAYVNIQGDEPLIWPATVSKVCRALEESDAPVVTARVRIDSQTELDSPHVNKVVTDKEGRALYFSRSVIPYPQGENPVHFKHLGIYGYRREFLISLDRLEPSKLEETEALEQLRFLENGVKILVIESEFDSPGVDVPEDVERVTPLLENDDQLPYIASPNRGLEE